MKIKLILIAIIGLIFSNPLFSNSQNLNTYNPEEKVYWDFLKERLFDGENSIVSSFQGDIYIHLDGASIQDSSIIENLMLELRQIITNRHFFLHNKKYEFDQTYSMIPSVNIGFNDAGIIDLNGYIHRSKNINGNQIFYDDDIFIKSINFKFNDSISFANRKRYIEYAIIKSLCTIKGDPKGAHTFVENAILSDFDYNPVNTEFSEVDKFVIQKLYSGDFHQQFKNYMLANSSWRYYLTFTHKDKMKVIGAFVAIILALIILVFSFKPIIRKNYRNQYYGYVFPGVLIMISAYFILLVHEYITTSATFHFLPTFSPILILTIIAIVLSSILYFIERFSINPQMKFLKQLVLKIFFMLVFVVVPFFILLFFILDRNNKEFVLIFVAIVTVTVLRGTIIYLKHVGDIEIREKEIELSVLKEANSRVELQSLHARINPHFLYNSLNSIAGLAYSNPDKTEKMALSLSDMFRYSLNRKNEVLADINDEVEMVRSYLEIEQIRFGERMSFSIEIDDELKSQQIPKFILQPLVENAIKHGISKIERKGEISLSIKKVNEKIAVAVFDNGPDFPEGLVAGYGLQSLYDLLKICYKNEAEVNWQNSPSKKISVKIPFNEKTN